MKSVLETNYVVTNVLANTLEEYSILRSSVVWVTVELRGLDRKTGSSKPEGITQKT